MKAPLTPHAYTPKGEAKAWEWSPCRYCTEGPGAPVHLHNLPGIETVPVAQPAPPLDFELSRCNRDITAAAERMEAESPLFRFTDANPQGGLF